MAVGRHVDREHFDATCFFSRSVRTETADSPQPNLNVYRNKKFKPNIMTWWSNCVSCTALHSVPQFRDYNFVLLKVQVFVTR